MISATKRKVFVFDLIVKTRAIHAQPPALLEVIEALVKVYADFRHEREKGAITYRIGALKISDDKKIAEFLFRQCDLGAPNAAYSDSNTGELTIHQKEKNQGGDKAAHMVVSLLETKHGSASYLCHLEYMPGLSHRLIKTTLNAAIKLAINKGKAVFRYPDPSGAKKDRKMKEYDFIPHLELEGYLSQSLIDEMEEGKIKNICLINKQGQKALGNSTFFEETKKTLEFRVKKEFPKKNKWKTIINAIHPKKDSYETARISFIDSDDTNKSFNVDIATSSLSEVKYIEAYFVDKINPPMDESRDSLHSEFIAYVIKKVLG